MSLGRRLVEKALNSYSLSLKSIPEHILQPIVAHAGLESLHHLYEEVGIGNRPALLVAKQIAKTQGDVLKKEGPNLHPSQSSFHK